MSYKQLVKTYPKEVQGHIRKKNIKTKKKLERYIGDKLPLKLQDLSFIVDQLRLKILFIDKESFDTTFKELLIPFNENWYVSLY
jgi:hypothetical protein